MGVNDKEVATGFGGGVGLFGDTCGAIAGAVIAASRPFGSNVESLKDPDADQSSKVI